MHTTVLYYLVTTHCGIMMGLLYFGTGFTYIAYIGYMLCCDSSECCIAHTVYNTPSLIYPSREVIKYKRISIKKKNMIRKAWYRSQKRRRNDECEIDESKKE